jgi:hypothetical protein
MENVLFAQDHARFMDPLRQALEQGNTDFARNHIKRYPRPFVERVFKTSAADWIVLQETGLVDLFLDAGVPVDLPLDPPKAGFRTLWSTSPSALSVAALTCQHDFAASLVRRGASFSPLQLGTLRETMGTGLVELVRNHVEFLEKAPALPLSEDQHQGLADQVHHWRSRLGELRVDPSHPVTTLIEALNLRMDALARPVPAARLSVL